MMIKKIVAVAAATGGLVLAGAGLAMADSGAEGATVGSPGVISGNDVQVPVHVPVNACGNTISVVGLLNPAFGGGCINA
jgi:ChpA-C